MKMVDNNYIKLYKSNYNFPFFYERILVLVMDQSKYITLWSISIIFVVIALFQKRSCLNAEFYKFLG